MMQRTLDKMPAQSVTPPGPLPSLRALIFSLPLRMAQLDSAAAHVDSAIAVVSVQQEHNTCLWQRACIINNLQASFSNARHGMLFTAVMKRGTREAILRVHDSSSSMTASLEALQIAHVSATRHRVALANFTLGKVADDNEATAKVMDACVAIAARVEHAVAVTTSILPLANAASCWDTGSYSNVCIPAVNMLLLLSFDGATLLRTEAVDGACSAMHGPGLHSFVKGAAGMLRNIVRVRPCLSTGELAPHIKPSDVSITLAAVATGYVIDAEVTVAPLATGEFELRYSVSDDCSHMIQLAITVCNATIGFPVVLHVAFDAMADTRVQSSFPVDNGNYGMAVSADGSRVVISVPNDNVVMVHKVEYNRSSSLRCLRVIGRRGSGPGEFQTPTRLCFTDSGNVLVCDLNNHRVQHLSIHGKCAGLFAVKNPWSVAAHASVCAVGTSVGSIETHDIASGRLIRSFATRGAAPFPTSLCFTPGGDCLLMAESASFHISIFSTDGMFIKRFGAAGGSARLAWNDVIVSAVGDIIVTDSSNNRICVYSSDGETLLRHWGSVEDGLQGQCKFACPKAVAVSRSQLFVMDDSRLRMFH